MNEWLRYFLYAVFVLLDYLDYSYSVQKLDVSDEMNPVARAIGKDRWWLLKTAYVASVIGIGELVSSWIIPAVASLFMAGVVAWNYVNEWLLRSEYEKRYNKPKYRVVE